MRHHSLNSQLPIVCLRAQTEVLRKIDGDALNFHWGKQRKPKQAKIPTVTLGKYIKNVTTVQCGYQFGEWVGL